MTDSAPSSVPPVLRQNAPQPGFLRALRGIWLFTWRSQLTWRRLPLILIGLLVLPLLVYLTTSPRVWSGRPSPLGDAGEQFGRMARGLARAGLELKQEQIEPLHRIFLEEFQGAAIEWRGRQNPETEVARDDDLVRECYHRIERRAQNVLDERQFAEFRARAGRSIQASQERASQPLWSRHAAFYQWLINFYFLIVLPLNCVRLTGALIRDELQADTLGFLTTRPLSRASLVIAKYLSQTAWLQIVLLVETLLLFVVGQLRQVAGLGDLVPLFLATQILAVLAWSALGLFLGLVTRRYIIIALLYGGIVEIGIGNIPTNINTLSIMSHIKSLLARSEAVQSVFEYAAKALPFSVGALLIAAGVFLGLAAFMFTFREYQHTIEMQK